MAKKKNTFASYLTALPEKINSRYVLWMITGLLVVGAVVFGTRRGWAELQRQPEFALSPDALTFVSAPPSIRPRPMQTALREEVKAILPESTIFDRDLCHSVAHELLASPWITEVTWVRRMYPRQIRVKAQFRRPAGIVETNRYRHMVDRWGYWLPKALYDQPEEWQSVDLPTIVDDDLASMPERGKRWNGPGLAIGASLTQTLLNSGILEEIEINHINVTNVGNRNTAADVVLHTAANRPIKWGATDAYDRIEGIKRSPGAPSDAEKISMLRSMLRDHPNLMGLIYVDLRYSKKVFKKPR